MLLVEKMLMSGGAPTDPYFEYVTLLLHGDGTNGGQNNTFLDGSSNNFTITRNGNTTQGSFNPYGSLWSNYFDGTGDYIDAPSGGAISGTGNFTVECWLYPSTISSGYKVVYANVTNNGFSFSLNSTGTLGYGRSNVATDGTTTGVLTFNAWNHIAWVRSGTGSNQFVCYINGVSAGTFTNSTSYASGTVRIGVDGNGSSFPYQGYISNLRVNTTAVYSADFTPPTSNLTAIANTILLTCQSNRFVDNSTNNYTITRNGDTKVTSFAPFAPTSVYTSAAGGSVYIDGNGDTLDSPATTTFNYGTGDFTYETWVYPESTPNDSYIISQPSAGSVYPLFLIYNGALHWQPGAANYQAFGLSVTNGQWNHIAAVRQGGTMYGFLNGVRGSTTHAYATSLGDGRFIRIATGNRYKGYLSDTRISNIAVYTTTTYTVPTSKVVATSSTNLLLNYTNAAIFDSAAKNDLETVGNAQIDTGTKKFGTGSIEFDGTGDSLTYVGEPLLTGDFTVEFWLYLNSTAVQQGTFTVGTADNSASFSIFISTAGAVAYYSQGNLIISSNGAVTTGVWYNITLARSAGSSKLFIDGTQVGSTYSDTKNYTSTTFRVGLGYGGITNLNGFIDDLRVTKGVARYTANFTPPNRAFPDK